MNALNLNAINYEWSLAASLIMIVYFNFTIQMHKHRKF